MSGLCAGSSERSLIGTSSRSSIQGLKRLEYRGYDSAGVAVLNGGSQVSRLRAVGKVSKLSEALAAQPTSGRLALRIRAGRLTGVPNERNAHPHISRDGVAIVHNGIIENHEELRDELEKLGYEFTSDTDTEVIAHRIHHHLFGTKDLFKAVQKTVAELRGAYSLNWWRKDMLFATLDPTMRAIALPDGRRAILSRHRRLHLRPAAPAGRRLPRHARGGAGGRPDPARARHRAPESEIQAENVRAILAELGVDEEAQGADDRGLEQDRPARPPAEAEALRAGRGAHAAGRR